MFSGGQIADNGGGRSQPRSGGIMGFLSNLAPAIPIVGGIASNILAGINERKARLYNSPANQVKRLREAGLPLAAGSNIQAGGGVSTKVSSLGTEGFNDNLGKSIIRNIDRKKLQIHGEELRSAKAAADIATGNAKNQLNPSGVFENTNQGLSTEQAIATQAQAIKTAELVNKYMPIEKAQAIMKSGKEMEKISADIKNTLIQNKIQVQDLAIKRILAKYQEDMSLNQLMGLIKNNIGQDLRNQGMVTDNAIKKIAYTIEWRTMLARIMLTQNQLGASGLALEAGRLGLELQKASLPSTQAYYEIRREMDEATKRKPNLANTLLYLGMFQPNTSNYNLGQLMPSYKGGNTYEQHTHFKTE